MRLRLFFEFELVFLGNRGMINAMGIVGVLKVSTIMSRMRLGWSF